MATSIKISEDDLLVLDKVKSHLKELGIKTTKKDLIHTAISRGVFGPSPSLISDIINASKRDRKEATEEFFSGDMRYDFKEEWLKELGMSKNE